jgi:AraC-like DNA-binding protein
MRAAMDRALRFHALANPLVPIRAVAEGDTIRWECPARHALMLPDLDDRLYRLLIELQLATHHTLAQDVMGAWCVPVQVDVGWPAPDDAAGWAGFFGPAPRFGAAACALHYPAAWLDRAPQLANAVTAAQTSRECARLLESLDSGAGFASRVYRELMRTPGPFPSIEKIAESLHMTGRTLRRHLSAEGTSYVDLLTRVRRALAEDYLRATRMTIDDIAAALAFSDARSFRHAFTRWTGCSPSDWRRARSGTAADAAARRA